MGTNQEDFIDLPLPMSLSPVCQITARGKTSMTIVDAKVDCVGMRHFDCNKRHPSASSPRGNYRGNLCIGLKHHDEIDILSQKSLCLFQRYIWTRLTIQGNEIYSRSLCAF